jgi:hypothetical protein
MMTQGLHTNAPPASIGFDLTFDGSAFGEFEPTPIETSGVDYIVDAVDKLLDCEFDYDDVSLTPTPIGSKGFKIVESVSLTESPWVEDGNFIACLSPFLKKRKVQYSTTTNSLLAMTTWDTCSASSTSCADARKRPRVDGAVTDDLSSIAAESENSSMPQLRPYQSDQWYEKFEKLVEFKRIHDHCLVPNNWGKNEPLALWVKRQRYQYRLKREGQHSTLTEEREAALDELGFVWDSHGAVWEERLAELKLFKARYGHCNVPAGSEDRQLAIWVKCQRRQNKLFCDGERSNITQERIAKLEQLGFVWNPRKLKTLEP